MYNSNMSKTFLGVLAAIVLLFAGIMVFSNKSSAPGSDKSNPKTLTQHIEGQGKTGVKLVEYGDYQCPFCGQYYPIVKQVQAEFNNQIFFQFRNFPLVGLHQNAFAGARAAEAAALQNKFWEMHDQLYESQQQWSESKDPMSFFKQYASLLGLNVSQFQQDYASEKINNLVNADMAEASKLKLTGTPTFFLDGKKVEIGQSVAAFEQVIKAEIAKKAPQQSTSTAPAPAQ
jgi:protein-disulfide isomerase